MFFQLFLKMTHVEDDNLYISQKYQNIILIVLSERGCMLKSACKSIYSIYFLSHII